ncbi:MAG: DUF1599 domain-containing protein [Deltaproteobacteria bacterium]
MEKTINQYNSIVKKSANIFKSKMLDYGSTWRVFRPESLIDQLFIKARRIRSIQQKQGKQMIEDTIEGEFFALYNYCIIFLIQLKLDFTDKPDLDIGEAEKLYTEESEKVKELMIAKNHDYGEAWRDMRLTSMADFILVKLFRIGQIISNNGKTQISEGIESNIADIANYSVFALILLNENKKI